MIKNLENLVSLYDEGQIGRRDLIKALVVAAAAAAPTASAAQPAAPAPVFKGSILNHVTLHVADLKRSRAFYEELVGAELWVDSQWNDTRIGDSMIDFSVGKTPGRIDHFAVGVTNWPGPERALEMVQKRFPNHKSYLRTNPIGAADPDIKFYGEPRKDLKFSGPGSKAKELTGLYIEDPDGILVQINDPKYQLV